MVAFDFITEYRALQPTAGRDQVAARSASFEKVAADAEESFERVVDLAYLAYRLPLPANSDAAAWFEGILRSDDSTFTAALDAEEAARIATLILKQRMTENRSATPVLVHAAAFAGKRQTVDRHGLSTASRRALADLVRRRGSSVSHKTASTGKPAAIQELITKLDETGGETEASDVFGAIHRDYSQQIKQVVTSTNEAVRAVWSENRRLAEEIDLLWWHLGGESYLLDRPILDLPLRLRPVVVGMDIGEMIGVAPGPHGTYGIIRKVLAETADQTFRLGDVLKDLPDDLEGLVSSSVSRYAVAPIHGAFGDHLLRRTPVAATRFKRDTGLTFETKITGYELAVQAYHERMLQKLDYI